jgi:hypothetical protein
MCLRYVHSIHLIPFRRFFFAQATFIRDPTFHFYSFHITNLSTALQKQSNKLFLHLHFPTHQCLLHFYSRASAQKKLIGIFLIDLKGKIICQRTEQKVQQKWVAPTSPRTFKNQETTA